jgi:aarF domain-containing kinase
VRRTDSTTLGEIFDTILIHLCAGLSLGRIGIGALLQRVLALCYIYQVKLEPKFVSVMIALGIVEGLGKRLDPDVDVLIRAAPYVLRASTM